MSLPQLGALRRVQVAGKAAHAAESERHAEVVDDVAHLVRLQHHRLQQEKRILSELYLRFIPSLSC